MFLNLWDDAAGVMADFEIAEEADLKELLHRVTEGSFGDDGYSGNNFNKELLEVLKKEIGEEM